MSGQSEQQCFKLRKKKWLKNKDEYLAEWNESAEFFKWWVFFFVYVNGIFTFVEKILEMFLFFNRVNWLKFHLNLVLLCIYWALDQKFRFVLSVILESLHRHNAFYKFILQNDNFENKIKNNLFFVSKSQIKNLFSKIFFWSLNV